MSLSTTIKAIQDIMRKDVGVDGDAQRIGQLVWILFLKIWDDREREIECLEDGYRSPLLDVRWIDTSGEVQQASDLRWRTWAADDEGMTGDELLNFVNDTLFPVLKSLDLGPPTDDPLLHASRSRKALMRRVFGDAYQYMKSGTLLRQVLSRVNSSIDFNNSKSRHLFGDLYEQILRDLQGAGNAGEYYTPRAVTQLAVDLVDPRLGEVFLDPACGTGGFLACIIEHIRAREVRTPAHEATLQSCLRGVEKKPLPHLLAVTNMIVHGIDVPEGVLHDNTLRRALNDYRAADRVDVILTNPPFGGMEEDGIERGFPADVRTRETADLFLVLIVELLKEGGRAAVVLPDGTLFGEGVKTRVKERLLSECSLHTIVRLPKGVFAPYTTIQTNLLFFTKGQPTTDVWFYEHPYPPGQRAYSKTRPLRIEEFDDLKTWWTSREEGERAWRWDFAGELAAALKRAQPLWDAADAAEREAVGLADELKALKAQERQSAAHKARIVSTQERLDETRRRARSSRAEGNAIRDAVYNLDRRNPHAPEAQHDDPDELLARFHQAQAEATDLREQLRRALADALEGRA